MCLVYETHHSAVDLSALGRLGRVTGDKLERVAGIDGRRLGGSGTLAVRDERAIHERDGRVGDVVGPRRLSLSSKHVGGVNKPADLHALEHVR